MIMRLRLRLLVVLGGLLVPLLVPGAAVADAPVEHGVDSFTEEETVDCGDFSIDVVDAWHIRYAVHPAPRDPYGQAFLASEVVRVERTVTNTTTGKTFTGRFHANFAEVRATHLSGTVYRFDQRETVSLLVRAPGGRPYVQEHVNLRHVQVFDTLGDSQPGGEEISFETTVVSGELFDDPDACEIAATLTT
jgi:hypothetical protein